MTGLLLASHQGHGRGGGFLLFPLLFLGLWVVAFVVVGRRWRHPYRHSGESVLAERYARGEIDEAEYRQRRSVLSRKD